MEELKYTKIPETFEARQFIGGQENATEIIEWMKKREYGPHPQWVPNVHTDDDEYLEIGRTRIRLNWWIVMNDEDQYEIYPPEVFEKKYARERVLEEFDFNPVGVPRAFEEELRRLMGVPPKQVFLNIYNAPLNDVRRAAGIPPKDEPENTEETVDMDDADVRFTGVEAAGMWYPRYFQLIGSNSRFFVGQKDGTIREVEQTVIPEGHTVYPITHDHVKKLGKPTCCQDIDEPENEGSDSDTNESARDDEMMAESRHFQSELSSLLNRWSAETVSGTPDFVLAQFLETVLGAWNDGVAHRAKWRGESVQLPSLQKMAVNSEYGQSKKFGVYLDREVEDVISKVLMEDLGLTIRSGVEIVRGLQAEGVQFRMEKDSDVEKPVVYERPPLGEEVGVFYNQDTMSKVRAAIDTLTERQIYTNVRKIKDNVTTDMVVEAFHKAGIVFREIV